MVNIINIDLLITEIMLKTRKNPNFIKALFLLFFISVKKLGEKSLILYFHVFSEIFPMILKIGHTPFDPCPFFFRENYFWKKIKKFVIEIFKRKNRNKSIMVTNVFFHKF